MKDVGANTDEKNGKENEKHDEEMTEKQSSKVKKIRRIIKSMMISVSVSDDSNSKSRLAAPKDIKPTEDKR